MNTTDYFEKYDKERIAEVALKAGTNYENFKQIALYDGACSGKLAFRLSVASGQEMTTDEILSQKVEQSA